MALQDLLAQRTALNAEIERLQGESRAQAIAQIKEIMATAGLTMSDIVGGASASPRVKPAKTGATVPPKFRNAKTGETWSGRGLQPTWLRTAIEAGASLEDFRLA